MVTDLIPWFAAFRRALDNGVRVVRVQTRPEPDHRWAKMLAELKDEFPARFDLFVLQNERVSQMSSTCAIDPEDARHNLVEIMLSSQKLFGTRAADVAGTGIFIEGSSRLARDARNRILSLTTSDVAVNPTTPEALP